MIMMMKSRPSHLPIATVIITVILSFSHLISVIYFSLTLFYVIKVNPSLIAGLFFHDVYFLRKLKLAESDLLEDEEFPARGSIFNLTAS